MLVTLMMWWSTRILVNNTCNCRSVFIHLSDASLVLNLHKCEFGKGVVSCLGTMAGQGMVKHLDAKIQAICAFSAPKTRKDLRRFLGMAGYYGCFCKNFSDVVVPLTNLSCQSVLFKWSLECQSAFDSIKLLLTSFPVLAALEQTIQAGGQCQWHRCWRCSYSGGCPWG